MQCLTVAVFEMLRYRMSNIANGSVTVFVLSNMLSVSASLDFSYRLSFYIFQQPLVSLHLKHIGKPFRSNYDLNRKFYSIQRNKIS